MNVCSWIGIFKTQPITTSATTTFVQEEFELQLHQGAKRFLLKHWAMLKPGILVDPKWSVKTNLAVSAPYIWVSKVISVCFGFALLRIVIGLKLHSTHPFRSKTKTIRKLLARKSCALRQLHVIVLSFDWFTWLSMSFVIGQCDNFGFGLTTVS